MTDPERQRDQQGLDVDLGVPDPLEPESASPGGTAETAKRLHEELRTAESGVDPVGGVDDGPVGGGPSGDEESEGVGGAGDSSPGFEEQQ